MPTSAIAYAYDVLLGGTGGQPWVSETSLIGPPDALEGSAQVFVSKSPIIDPRADTLDLFMDPVDVSPTASGATLYLYYTLYSDEVEALTATFTFKYLGVTFAQLVDAFPTGTGVAELPIDLGVLTQADMQNSIDITMDVSWDHQPENGDYSIGVDAIGYALQYTDGRNRKRFLRRRLLSRQGGGKRA